MLDQKNSSNYRGGQPRSFAPQFRLATVGLIATIAAFSGTLAAQEIQSFKLVPKTIYEKRPVKVTRLVDEVVNEKQQVTTQKVMWQTETRQRRQVEYMPVRKMSEREERTVVRKPVTETMYREKRTEETTYDTAIEMRDEQYTVTEPVIETKMREEKYTVRKPVTQKLVEVQRTTSYKPVCQTETRMVQQDSVVQQSYVVRDSSRRPRLRALSPGFYSDPVTGETAYRNRGLHWVQPSTTVQAAATVPTLVPQQTNKVSYIPEVVEKRTPVEVTRFVEKVETRRVPYEVKKMVDRVETRKVPVEVKIPKKKVTIEQVPYTRTTYKDEVTVKKVPYTETTYEKIEKVESYEVEVPRWVTVTKEVDVPRTVTRRVEYEVMKEFPRTIMMKVPLDACGNPVGPAVPVDGQQTTQPVFSNSTPADGVPRLESDSGSTSVQRVAPESNGLNVVAESSTSKPEPYRGDLQLLETKTIEEKAIRVPSSVLIPDTTPTAENPRGKLLPIPKPNVVSQTPPPTTTNETSGRNELGSGESRSPGVGAVAMPDDVPVETGDENAAERPPTDSNLLTVPKWTPPSENKLLDVPPKWVLPE